MTTKQPTMADNELTVEEIGEIEELAHAGGSPRPEFVLMLCDMARRYATEIPRLEKLVYVPGLWRCAKCAFQLVQSNLNAKDGTITARNDPGDKCPNCNVPLWRVTERDAGNDMVERCEEQIAHTVKVEAELATATAQVERMRGALEATEDALDNRHDCPDCEGYGEPEACGHCFGKADDARLKRRAVLADLPETSKAVEPK